jgi:hypothetical protein
MRNTSPLLVLFVAASLGLVACSDEGDPVSPADPGDPSRVFFSSDVQPVFDANCIGCHGAGGNGGLDLRPPQSYDNLVDVVSPNYDGTRVAPGEPDKSVLMDKISGGDRFGSRMPPTGSGLSDSTIETIRTWVLEGAPRN